MEETEGSEAKLSRELVALRQRVAELQSLEAECARANKNLQQACEYVQTIIDSIGDPVIVIDVADFSIIKANRAAKEAMGILDTEGKRLICYRAFHRREHPCTGSDEPCPLDTVVASKNPARFTHVHYDVEGNESYVDIFATPVFDSEGKVVQIVESCRDITELKRMEEERKTLIHELREALARIKTLNGLIRVCAWCRRVHTDKGYWHNLERYVREHSDAQFTHGICPDCLDEVEVRGKNSRGETTEGLETSENDA